MPASVLMFIVVLLHILADKYDLFPWMMMNVQFM